MLAELHRAGQLHRPRARGVTPTLAQWYADADDDELEYAAYHEAAQDSLRLLAADPAAPPRRVVIAADVPAVAASSPAEADDRSAVTLHAPVPRRTVVAIHIDGIEAVPVVRAAAQACAAADGGDPAAAREVAQLDDHELEWFDSSELELLLD